MQHLSTTLAFVTLLATAAVAAETKPPPVFDDRAFAEAKQAAADADKWLIIKGTAVWCLPCKRMDQTTWRDDDVVKWLEEHAVAIQLDVDAQPQQAHQLNIKAMPTTIAWKKGAEFDRIVGYRDPDAFLTWLQAIARGEKTGDRPPNAGPPPEKPPKHDIQARLDYARQLLQRGDHEQATKEYVWLWQNMLEHDVAFTGVRLSFMASQMERLAQQHPPARKRFTKLRDEATKQLERQADAPPAANQLLDWIVLNEVVGDPAATLQWFDEVKDNPDYQRLINRVSFQLKGLLLAEERWADLGRIYTNPLQDIAQQHAMTEMMRGRGVPEDLPDEVRERFEQSRYDHFRTEAGQVYAALLAADRNDEAQQVAARARQLDDSPGMLAALIETALSAEEPRDTHLEWIDQHEDPGATLRQLRKKTEQALSPAD